jgi:hypothetical protein
MDFDCVDATALGRAFCLSRDNVKLALLTKSAGEGARIHV